MFCLGALNNSCSRPSNSSFYDILENSNENLGHLAKEIYQFAKVLSSRIMNNFYSRFEKLLINRNFQFLHSEKKKTVKFGGHF